MKQATEIIGPCPRPLDNGWGSQPHIVAYKRKLRMYETEITGNLVVAMKRDLPEVVQHAICRYLYLPPLPLIEGGIHDGGWGRKPHMQRHIITYKRKHKKRRKGWGIPLY
jgi:hypothetical protein